MTTFTISPHTPIHQYVAAPAQVAFPVQFQWRDDEDLNVYVDNALKTLNTHYTLTGAGVSAGGTLTFTAPMAGNEVITIYGDMPIARDANKYSDGTQLPAHVLEQDLDDITMKMKQNQRDAERTLHLAPWDPSNVADFQLPLPPARANKIQGYDAQGRPSLVTVVSGGTILSQAIIGAIIYPPSGAEDNTPITPDTRYQGLPYDLRRVGLVPNSTAARAANTQALKDLFDPDLDGPTGWFILPNTTGNDTYYFAPDAILVRDGCLFDGQACTVNVDGAFNVALDLHGIFQFIRDVRFENFTYVVDYDGTGGVHNGTPFFIGMRGSYPFGNQGGEEEDIVGPMMGNCAIVDVRITSANPLKHIILMCGGIHNTLIKGCTLDGTGVATDGISYEFGHHHYAGGAAGSANITSHALNLVFENNIVRNVAGTALHITGAMTPFVRGLVTENVGFAFNGRPGEANYYNMTGTATEGMKAHYDLKGIFVKNGGTITLQGAQNLSGYLATELGALTMRVTQQALADQISFSLDGFFTGGAIVAAGRFVRIANGLQRGANTSGGILLQDECVQFSIENVYCVDNQGQGVRSQTGTAVQVKSVTAATSANPIAITTSGNHGLLTGAEVSFSLMPGSFATPLNGLRFPITVTGANTFTVAVNGAAFPAYTSGGMLSLPRDKTGIFTACKFAGNGSLGGLDAGVSLANCIDVVLDNCAFGKSLQHDGVDEPFQGAGVSTTSSAFGTTIRNSVGRGTQTTMFINAGGGGWKHAKLENCIGITTVSGRWLRDGHGMDADLGDAGATVTLIPDFHLPEQRAATALTAARTMTLTGAYGDRWHVTRTGLGAGTLDFGGLKLMPAAVASWAEAIHDGTAFRLNGYGLL